VKQYRFEAESAVELDVESAFYWTSLKSRAWEWVFSNNFVTPNQRILKNPLGYQELHSGIRRALTRQFPYAIYFSIEGDTILILAVLHTARDPAEWQRRI
jgi:toxin ParE1/3/4